MTSEKILEYLKANKSLCEEFMATTTNYIAGAETIIKRSYITGLIELIEEYDDSEVIRKAVDGIISLANEDGAKEHE